MYDKVTNIHLEPTTKCNARCPQCPRNVFGSSLLSPDLTEVDFSVEEAKQIFSDPFYNNINFVSVNGTSGDIVMHSEAEMFMAYIISRFPNIELHTNGGAKGKDFWISLAKPNVRVEFGIDGLEDTHHLYRRNTRFDTVIKNAKTYIDAGGNATWMMTVFKHNEHQIEMCKSMSKELGFKNFVARPSTRFESSGYYPVVDKNYNIEYWLEQTHHELFYGKNSKQNDKENAKKFWLDKLKADPFLLQGFGNNVIIDDKVDCFSKKNNSIFITAKKEITPCCWISNPYDKNYKNLFNRLCKKYNIENTFNNLLVNNVEDILKGELFKILDNNFKINKNFKVCSINCSIANKT
tara:strand:+ start:9537 stop:10586 length:1050 start_codon:yes stop_codon:yes gene_type:complete